MLTRSAIVSICLLIGGPAARHLAALTPGPAVTHLRPLPTLVDGWMGQATSLDTRTRDTIGTDEYVDLVYERSGEGSVGLYIAYYPSQEAGTAVHSPLNCLPASGWSSGEREVVPLADMGIGDRQLNRAPGAGALNRVVVRKGSAQLLVVYGYASHGRVVASEYWGKAYLVLDAIRMHRTDTALIRMTTAIGADEGDERGAEMRMRRFVQKFWPVLARSLPA